MKVNFEFLYSEDVYGIGEKNQIENATKEDFLRRAKPLIDEIIAENGTIQVKVALDGDFYKTAISFKNFSLNLASRIATTLAKNK